MYLHFTPRLLQWAFPSLLWHKPRTSKTLYLTFDDGPIPEVTPQVLAMLRKWNAKASFFCVGENVQRYPEVLKQVQEGGHRLGNHTFHHVKGVQVTTENYLQEVLLCQQVLEKYSTNGGTGEKPLFRPPYGRFTKPQRQALVQQYQLVMWDVLSADYDVKLSREVCLQKSIRYSKPGSIIVFHDSLKAWPRLEWVLPRYLEHFSKAGFSFASL